MRDPAMVATCAGVAGAAIVDGLLLLTRWLGVKTQTAWEIGADIFLYPDQARTTAGLVLGLIVTIVLSTVTAFAILIFLRLSGMNYAPFKGLLVTEATGFVTLGFIAPLLGIAPQLRSDLVTNYTAVIILAAMGVFQGWLIRRLLGVRPVERRSR